MVKYRHSDPLFTISVAAQLVNLHPRTIMLYEKAQLIKPFRTKTDRRRYSHDDLEKIKFINYLTRVKRINLAGIKIVFDFLIFGKKHNLKMKEEFFSDFIP